MTFQKPLSNKNRQDPRTMPLVKTGFDPNKSFKIKFDRPKYGSDLVRYNRIQDTKYMI